MRLTPEHVLDAVRRRHAQGDADVGPRDLIAILETSPATLRRHLDALVRAGRLIRIGRTKATRYRDAGAAPVELGGFEPSLPAAEAPAPPAGSAGGVESSPPVQAGPVAQSFAADSMPDDRPAIPRVAAGACAPTSATLLPPALEHDLDDASRAAGDLAGAALLPPALVLDVSWSSSRLEGSPLALVEALELVRSGREHGDAREQLLLNHRRTLEFAHEHVPAVGLSGLALRGLHDLLVVGVGDPGFDPALAAGEGDAALDEIAAQARALQRPVQAAFHLWTTLSRVRPFAAGNAPFARIAANLPLLLAGRPPMSFLHVSRDDYDDAFASIVSHGDFTGAIELFAGAFRRSMRTAAAVAAALR